MFQSLIRSAARVASCLVLCAFATAQLELPDRPIGPRESKDALEIKPSTGGDLNKQVVPGKNDGVDTARSNEKLDLPAAPASAASTAGAPPVAPPSPPADSSAALRAQALPTSAAAFVLGEIAKVEDLNDELLPRAVESLVRMGAAGRDAAVLALQADHAASVAVGARVLLASGRAEDAELVQRRLRQRLPAGMGAPLVDTLIELDPVRASPQFLLELLAHPQAAVRNAAQRHLDRRSDLPLDSIAALSQAKESDTRARAVQLASRSTDPLASGLLLERLADPTPLVARHAVAALALREDERLDAELMRRAFEGRWILRSEAYALLALVEREDRGPRAILSEAHAPKLLEGLSSRDPFVAGACAAALAGVGFRSTDASASAWLDLDVPHRLVRVVAAEDFSPDYASLSDIAARRLALLSERNLGSDGPAWLAWWKDSAGKFRARRAILPARIEDAGGLRVTLWSNAEPSEAFTLLGPVLAEAPERAAHAPVFQGDTLFLSETQACALFEVLRDAGVFGAERLPGLRGASSALGRTLTVALGADEKSFRFAGVKTEDWFERAVEALRLLHERNSWQRCADGATPTSQLELWRAEAFWWDQPREQVERDRRLAELWLAKLTRVAPQARDAGVEELARLQAASAVLGPADFPALLVLARSELFVGQRLRDIVALALAAGREPGAPATAPVRADLADQLARALLAQFGVEAAQLASNVLSSTERSVARQHAHDADPLLRAIAATTLAQGASDEDTAELLELLKDSDERVEGAAVLALGEQRIEAARTEIAVRARAGKPSVRAKALVAMGLLGGQHALDVLLAGLTQRDQPEIYVASARGLVELRDPQTVPLFVALLSKGTSDPAYEHARRGLIYLGEGAWPDLLRIARSTDHKARREATLVLAEQCVPESVSALLALLTENPDDTRAAEELCVITCVDQRGEADPPLAWWNWWEYVVHDDAGAWFCGALERLGAAPPTPDELRAGGRAAREFVFDVLQRDEPHLVERARRELARMIGRDPGALPPPGPERRAWIASLREVAESKGQ